MHAEVGLLSVLEILSVRSMKLCFSLKGFSAFHSLKLFSLHSANLYILALLSDPHSFIFLKAYDGGSGKVHG